MSIEAKHMDRRSSANRSQALRLLALFATVSCGCHTLNFGNPLVVPPEKVEREPRSVAGLRSFRVSQFVFQADFELKKDQPIFQELAELREQIVKELQLPPSTTLIHVQLFEDRDRYERFMQTRYPDLPKRRAFFVAQPRSVGGGEDLLVYTFWGERIRQDLRHELTHAVLHSVLKDVPLWLDEGLAEYYEVAPGLDGVHQHHLELIRRQDEIPFIADMRRLEELSQVQQMNPPEYREAWAWVHLMLRGKPEVRQVLLAYLQQLRTQSNPGPLQPRLAQVLPAPEQALQDHLRKLKTDKTAILQKTGTISSGP